MSGSTALPLQLLPTGGSWSQSPQEPVLVPSAAREEVVDRAAPDDARCRVGGRQYLHCLSSLLQAVAELGEHMGFACPGCTHNACRGTLEDVLDHLLSKGVCKRSFAARQLCWLCRGLGAHHPPPSLTLWALAVLLAQLPPYL